MVDWKNIDVNLFRLLIVHCCVHLVLSVPGEGPIITAADLQVFDIACLLYCLHFIAHFQHFRSKCARVEWKQIRKLKCSFSQNNNKDGGNCFPHHSSELILYL